QRTDPTAARWLPLTHVRAMPGRLRLVDLAHALPGLGSSGGTRSRPIDPPTPPGGLRPPPPMPPKPAHHQPPRRRAPTATTPNPAPPAAARLAPHPLHLAPAAGDVLTRIPILGHLLGGGQSQPSQLALNDIPDDYKTLYITAATTCPGLDWSILAAIGKIESD